jgi:methylmalonyl-CoA mutase N-terminal domain/subunit
LRTQQIIAHETGVANTIDPVAGSYAIEALTAQVEKSAIGYLERIDALGGMLAAIESGYVQKEIQKSAFEYQRAVETKQQIVVGVNEFQAEEERQMPTLRIDPAMEREQVARLEALRSKRDAAKTQSALRELGRRQMAAKIFFQRSSARSKTLQPWGRFPMPFAGSLASIRNRSFSSWD